jgi:hypothetical protein
MKYIFFTSIIISTIICNITFSQTKLGTTKVWKGLENQIDIDGNFSTINFSDGTSQTTKSKDPTCPSGFTDIIISGNKLGCMQTTEESTANWFEAADSCFTLYGGKLPSVNEWYISMNNFTLTDEADDAEWTDDVIDEGFGGNFALMGAGSITTISKGADNDINTFRCFLPR